MKKLKYRGVDMGVNHTHPCHTTPSFPRLIISVRSTSSSGIPTQLLITDTGHVPRRSVCSRRLVIETWRLYATFWTVQKTQTAISSAQKRPSYH